MMPTVEDVLARDLERPYQYDAAIDDSPEILALACAGSGKSRTLAYRIARLLVNGESPNAIVAFTFTEKASESIKLRVTTALKAVGLPETALGAMYIGTIHSYCQQILGAMDAKYRQFDVLDGNRLKLYLISRRWKLGLKKLQDERSERYFETIRQVADAWSVMHDEQLDIADIKVEDPTLGEVLENLGNNLNEDQFIDFSLMIRLVVDGLKAKTQNSLNAVAAVKHLIVDEYQDVNPIQEALIAELHALGANLFVVGDDDQAIYSWRGADVSNILDFQTNHPSCAVHTLPKNFRSTPAIVDAADAFIAAELGARRLSKSPQANPPETPRDFRNLWFPNRDEEAIWIVERVQALLGKAYKEKDGTVRGLTPADFAILLRSTRQAEQTGVPRHVAFTSELEKRGISYSLEAGGGVFDRAQVRVLSNAFGLLGDQNPDRMTVVAFFRNEVLPNYPFAKEKKFINVVADWGRKIHPPVGVRQRLFPQQLVYDLLNAMGIQESNFDAGIMQDIGVFSRILQDVETVYLSVDSTWRFKEILIFLSNIAESGYDSSTDDVLQRPDTVTVSTVHKMKGLEFPVVFVVDLEAQRFPKRRSSYGGWLPQNLMASAIARGAYQSTHDEEARLFYTAITRAERFLYLTGSANLPGGKRRCNRSSYALRITGTEVLDDPTTIPADLVPAQPMRRVNETVVPTSFSQVRYYMRCPKDYQFRNSYGFSPSITEMFGFGKTVHTAVEKLHELYPQQPPTPQQAVDVAEQTFHLKHVAPSADPVQRPGAYERAKTKAGEILTDYAASFGADFQRKRAVEVPFEIPLKQAVLSGAIDLLLKVDEQDQIVDATVVDFKAIQGGEDPFSNSALNWVDLSLQVQLYAHAAREVLTENAKTGTVHLLKDNQRVEVPVTSDAIQAAIQNVEWAVDRIIAGDFPMRPHPEKCVACDFAVLCPQKAQNFGVNTTPVPIRVPQGQEMVSAFRLFQP